MSQPNKPRLSDVTKKNTADRASKLASSFLSDDDPETEPAPAPVAEAAQPAQAEAFETPTMRENVSAEETSQPAVSSTPAPPAEGKRQPLPSAERPKERVRRSSQTVDLPDLINQPTPEGLRCSRMIMLSEEHHDMLRELHFKFKKPMSAILYNLLEPAHQALQREHEKGK